MMPLLDKGWKRLDIRDDSFNNFVLAPAVRKIFRNATSNGRAFIPLKPLELKLHAVDRFLKLFLRRKF